MTNDIMICAFRNIVGYIACDIGGIWALSSSGWTFVRVSFGCILVFDWLYL